MRTLHIIMPMAGEGSRFVNAGWTTPKPLIEVGGKPLFLRAAGSLSGRGWQTKYSFIVRQSHITDHRIDGRIRQYLPEANVFSVERTTRGAVETCLIAERGIADDDAVVVMDCDLEFRSEAFLDLIEQSLLTEQPGGDGGALVSFESSDPRYSYALTDADGLVVRTAEKEPISTHALCGAYFFCFGSEFKRVAHRLLIDGSAGKPELYVSLLYNYLLADGKRVRLATLDQYRSYGTPEELAQFASQCLR